MNTTFLSRSIVILFFCSLGVATGFAGQRSNEVKFKGATVAAIEENLAIGLSTGNAGLQASASQVVRNLKALLPEQDFSLLVIPLMRIVKDANADIQVRMIGALALHDLQSARGDFAILRAARFETNERLRRLCTWLAYEQISRDK